MPIKLVKFLVKSLYYDINELNDKLNDSQSIFKKTFSLMHVNISSLKYHLDKLSDLIDKSEAKFGVIGITESRLSKDIAPLNNINLHNYNIQHTPTESNKEALYCISQQTSVTKLEMI